MARAAAELVVARHQVAVVDAGGLTHGAEHAGVDAELGLEHRAHGLVRRVDRREARGGGVGHGRPAGRAVGVGQLLEHLECGDGVGLEPPDLGRHQQPEQARVGQRVDDLGGHRAMELGALGVGLDQRTQGTGQLDGRWRSGAVDAVVDIVDVAGLRRGEGHGGLRGGDQEIVDLTTRQERAQRHLTRSDGRSGRFSARASPAAGPPGRWSPRARRRRRRRGRWPGPVRRRRSGR